MVFHPSRRLIGICGQSAAQVSSNKCLKPRRKLRSCMRRNKKRRKAQMMKRLGNSQRILCFLGSLDQRFTFETITPLHVFCFQRKRMSGRGAAEWSTGFGSSQTPGSSVCSNMCNSLWTTFFGIQWNRERCMYIYIYNIISIVDFGINKNMS